MHSSTAPQAETSTVPGESGGAPLVGVLMGSSSDWETLQQAAAILTEFGVAHARIGSQALTRALNNPF